MNRAQRRAETAREKMQHNADRIRRLVDEKNVTREQLDQFRVLLFAAARAAGRLVVRREDIASLGENDRVDFIQRDNGDVVVEYASGTASAS